MPSGRLASRPRRARIVAAVSLAGALALAFALWQRQPAPAPAVFEGAAHLSPAPCPADALLIVAFGQSQAANEAERRLASTRTDVLLVHDGRCFHLADPVPGATGTEGSIWAPALDAVAAATGRPVALVSAAAGGTRIGDWTAPGSPLAARLDAQLADARRAGLAPALLVWMQGETDAAAGIDAVSYRQGLDALHRRFGSAPWLITRNSICGPGSQPSAALAAARAAFARSTPDVSVAADLDSLGASHRRPDGCHFNHAGQQRAGAIVGRAIVVALAAAGGSGQR